PLAIPMLSSRSPCHPLPLLILFFLNAPAPTDIYTLSLHDALPIYWYSRRPAPGRRAPLPHGRGEVRARGAGCSGGGPAPSSTARDRKSTRLNSSHQIISYAVFCLKKKKQKTQRSKSRNRTTQIRHT